MACKKQDLFKAYLKLLGMGSHNGSADAGASGCEGMTPKQIHYLRIIDGYDALTCSDLAQYTANSKPTVTEMVNRFIDQDCVIKQRSVQDKRVCYIRLTAKGQRIARAEELQILQIIDRIESCLNEEEIEELIYLLNKIS